MEEGQKEDVVIGEKGEIGSNSANSSLGALITFRPEIMISRNKKLFSALSYFVNLTASLGFLIGFVIVDVQKSQLVRKFYLEFTYYVFYVLFLLDIVASLMGIWSCLARTGPRPMLIACVTLFLTALVNVFLPIELTVDINRTAQSTPPSGEDTRPGVMCQKSPNSEECKDLKMISLLFWVTYALIALKVLVIIICRINYPHVFNWTHGIEEARPRQSNSILITNSGQSIHGVHSQTIAPGMFFSPVDINRMSMRGSLPEGELYRSTRHGSVFAPRMSIVSGVSMSSRRQSSMGASATSVHGTTDRRKQSSTPST